MFKEFILSDVLNVERAKCIPSKENLIDGDIPYVTRSAVNNGKVCTCGNTDKVNSGNCISVGGEGGAVFYQPKDWVAGNNMCRLWRDGLEKEEYIYIVSLMNKITHIYSYTNARTQEKIKREFLYLPVIKNPNSNHEYTVDDIDWQYMRDYIKELEHDYIKELDAYLQVIGLNDYELTEEDKKVLGGKDKVRFGEFALKKLFTSQTGDVDLQQKDINGKGIFFINSGVENRGIKGKTDREAKVFPANTITIDFWGNAYYRDFEYKMATHNHVFSLSGDVIKNKAVGLYIIGKLSKLPQLFSYNNMATWNKLKALKIELPITQKDEPDFDYMERYIRAIEKVVIADVVKYKDKVIEATKKVVNE